MGASKFKLATLLAASALAMSAAFPAVAKDINLHLTAKEVNLPIDNGAHAGVLDL